MTSSASICIEIGTSIPSALAVFMLMTSSNLVGCMTGRSAGFSPLRIRLFRKAALLLDHERSALRLPDPHGVFGLGRIDLDVDEADDRHGVLLNGHDTEDVQDNAILGSDEAMLRDIRANRQRPQQTAEEPATKSQADIWMAETKKEALAAFDAFIETWGVKYDKAAECLIKDRDALLALRFPGRAVEASAHHERHRKCVRHGAPSHHAVQRMSLKQDRARHDLQARRGCRKKLASPQWPQPVAENHPRYKVHRWNRSSQIASSNRCRLIPSVTKIRQ